MKKLSVFLAVTVFCLTSCSEPTIESYANNKPVFDIREYLNGDLEAWGVFINFDGSADPQFHVAMKGRWNGNEGTLDEIFTYTNGDKRTRHWKFRMVDDHHFIATAADVIGEGKGAQYGNAVNLKYTLQVPRDGKMIEVAMDDWLYRIDDTHVINRTEMRKFGFKVGEPVIGFRKLK